MILSDWLHVEAAFYNSETEKHTFRVMWVEGGSSDEVEGETNTFPGLTHSEMEMEHEVVGKIIRVYWAADKDWFIGEIAKFDPESGNHHIKYDDDDEESLNLISLEKERPAWELSPFSTEYFGF